MGKFFEKTHINANMEECWEFFSKPENLATITPPEMDFKIVGHDGQKMHEGQQISYTVKPLLGIPVKWKTEIRSVKEGLEFVDVQIRGPYKIWHHRHLFRKRYAGVDMIDIVHYQAPYGFFGRILERWFINKKVRKIFQHRSRVIQKLFP